MQQLVLLIHVIVAVCLIAIVLLQQGKGATAGAAFGSGASQSVFGSRGATSFLAKITTGLALIFFLTSLTLTRLAAKPAPTPELVVPQQHSQAVPIPATETKSTIPMPTGDE